LFEGQYNLIAVTNLFSTFTTEDCSIVAKNLFSYEQQPEVRTVSVLPLDKSTLFSIPCILDVYGDAIRVVVAKISVSDSTTKFDAVRIIEITSTGSKVLSNALLDQNTLALAFQDCSVCPKGTAISTFSVADGSSLNTKCLNNYIKKSSFVYPFIARVNDDLFLLVSSFFYHLTLDNVDLWRDVSPFVLNSKIDVPFMALVEKDSLRFVDARTVFSEPSLSFQSVGILNGDTIRLLFSGTEDYDQPEYSFCIVDASTKTCENGFFFTDAEDTKCVCTFGEDEEEEKCPDHFPDPPQPNPDSNSNSGDSPNTPSSLIEASLPASEEEPFFGSQTSMIIFGATAALCLVVTVVFVALFIKKRCKKSSGSGDTEMSYVSE